MRRGIAPVLLLTAVVAVAPTVPALAAANWGTTGCYPVDTVPPDLQDLTMTPPSVDVTAAAKTVSITVHATDSSAPGRAVSGVSLISVGLRDAAAHHGGTFLSATLHRVSGDGTDGMWAGKLQIPRWSAGGAAGQAWSLVSVFASDAAGNGRQWTTQPGPDDLRRTSWTKSVTVVSTPDVTKPDLRAWSFNPRTVDTTQRRQTVEVSARLHDAQSGVARARVIFTSVNDPRHVARSVLHRVSGTAAGGTWRGKVTLRRWMGSGPWTATVRAADRATNHLIVNAKELRASGWPSRLSVVSGSDTSRPLLLKVGFPTVVDVRSSDRKLTVTATASDSQSGVRSVQAAFELGYIGGDSYTIYVQNMRLISGTSHHGVWRGSTIVPRCESWRSLYQPTTGRYAAAVDVIDWAGNDRGLTGDGLQPFGPAALHLRATSRDLASPGVSAVDATSTPGTVKVTFFRDVIDVRVTNVELVDQVTSDPVAFDAVTCEDANGGAVGCVAGPVRTASFTLSSPLTSGRSYGLYLNQNSTADQLTNRNGIPAIWGVAPAFINAS